MQHAITSPQVPTVRHARVWPRASQSIIAAVLAGGTAFVCRWFPHVDATAVALILVSVVVGIALRCGRIEAVIAALIAALSLDYYFLPPEGFLGIESPDHIVALIAFLITAFGIAVAKGRASEKAMEAEIVHRSDELKSAVFSALAHDARGPLSSIKVAATTLLSDHPGNAMQQRELAGIILEEVDRMNRWIDEAGEVSQVGAAKFTPNRSPHEVRELISAAIGEFGPRLADRPIAIEMPDALPKAECDGELIRHVLKLLLDNAVKYSPFGSPIRVSSGSGDGKLVITVADAGPGVPEDERQRIFEKHYRGVHENSGIPGTGLGLTSARQMLESQGGEIWVTNRAEGGSEFHFSLPSSQLTI